MPQSAEQPDLSPTSAQSVCLPAVRWTVADGGDTRALGDRLVETLASGQAQRIKSNALRDVYRIGQLGLPGLDEVYLKRFDESSPPARLKRLVRGPAARIEFHRICRAFHAGVAVPPPVAFGVNASASFLVTASCQPACNLNAYFDEHEWDDQVCRLLADLLVTTHSAGLLHRDLHAGNILYRGGDQPGMWLLDLQRARFVRKLSAKSIAGNLGVLTAGLSAWLSEEQIEQLLREYRRRAGSSSAPAFKRAGPSSAPAAATMAHIAEGKFIAAVRSASRRHAAAQLRARERDIFKTGKYFSHIDLPAGWSGHVFCRRRRQRVDETSLAGPLIIEPVQWQAALADVRRLIAAEPGPGEFVYRDKSHARVVRRMLTVGPHELDVFVKQRRRSLPGAMLDLVRGSRAGRAFRDGHRLMMRGLSTVLPLAILVRRWAGLPVESVLITESAAEAIPLNRFVERRLPNWPADEQVRIRQDLARQLGRAVAVLWQAGLVHRDLKTPNVLVRCRPGQPPRVLLIDLDGLRRSLGSRSRAMIRLAQSAAALPGITRGERLRAMRHFLGPGANWKRLWRSIERRLARRADGAG